MRRALLGLVLLCAAPRAASACVCFGTGDDEVGACLAYRAATAIFTGEVLDSAPTGGVTLTTLKVIEAFRGVAGPTVLVVGGLSTCDLELEVGERYFVYATPHPQTGRLGVSRCSGTKKLAGAAVDLAFARAGDPGGQTGPIVGVVQAFTRATALDYRRMQPVAGARVRVAGPTAAALATGADGRFRVEHPVPGHYSIQVTAPPRHAAVPELSFDLGAGDCGTQRRFMTDALGRIHGRVVDHDGKPHPKVRLVALPAGATASDLAALRGREDTDSTDADGRYTIRWLAPGRYVLAVRDVDQIAPATDGWPYAPLEGRDALTIAGNEELAAPDLRLPAPYLRTTLEIDVVRADGKPAAGSFVAVEMDERGWRGDLHPTDARGHVALPLFRDHTYRVLADQDVGGHQTHSRPVAVKMDHPTERVRLVITDEGASTYDVRR
jgi:hypothetical protein